jgi:hypothetical protein
MPTSDDIDHAMRQRGDPSYGVRILGTDDASARRSTDTVPDSSMGKGKEVPSRPISRSSSRPLPSDAEV